MNVDFDGLVNKTVVSVFGLGASSGLTATYKPQTGAAFALDGIFDAAWRDVDPKAMRNANPITVSTDKPVFGCRLADFPQGVAPAQDDQITINGTPRNIADVKADGVSGWVLLVLQ